MEDNSRIYLKHAIIVDLGTGEVRAGSNLLDKADITFPNYIGTPKYQKIIRNFDKDSAESKEIYVGKDCDKYKGILKLRYPIKNGVFNNEQDILTIFNHIYDKLKITNKEEHPVFITEPILNPLYHRKQIASILFETLGVPAVFFGSQPILSLYSSNHKTGIVLESGEGITQCCVAFEGFAIPHSYIRYDFGGKNVTEYLQTLLRRCGHNFNTTSEFEIVKKIKEEMCYALLSSSSSDERRPNESNETKYLLPDGNHVPIREEKVMAPEILFDPLRVGLENLSLPDMISTSISKVDIDIRNPLYKNIFLCGGNTMIKGVPERITNEIKKSAPKHTKIMLHAPASRKNSCFTGALIISNLGSFKGMWVTKNDYKEKGDKEIYIKTI